MVSLEYIKIVAYKECVILWLDWFVNWINESHLSLVEWVEAMKYVDLQNVAFLEELIPFQ